MAKFRNVSMSGVAFFLLVGLLTSGISFADAQAKSPLGSERTEGLSEVVWTDAIQPLLQIELQDENTSLVQEVDPNSGYFRLMARQGEEHLVLFLDRQAADGTVRPVKDLTECGSTASTVCGTAGVSSLDYEESFFGLIECCHFVCNQD